MNLLNRRLNRIRKFIDKSQEDTKYYSLFASKPGKKFGRHLSDLSGFILGFCLLNIPLGEIQEEWTKIWKAGKFEELKEYSTSLEGFSKMNSLLEIMASIPQSDWPDVSKVMGKREIRRFLAFLTLSSSAYLDAYFDSLMDVIKESEYLTKKTLSFLEKHELKNRRTGTIVKDLKQISALGSSQFIEVLNLVCEVKGLCNDHFDKVEFLRYQKFLKFFIRLRGKISHGNPEPSLKKFDHSLFDESKKALQNAMKELWSTEKIPSPLIPLNDILRNWMNRNIGVLGIIFAVPVMVVLPTALLDVAIEYHRQK